MKLPLKWLKEYVDVDVTNDEFVERLMWRGFEVANILDEMPGICGVVVGRIVALEKHPNADKLSICSVDVGRAAPLCIVTGATNVSEGSIVPVALDGAALAGGITIKPTVMRGVESDGMLCSGKELGLTEADYPGAEVHGILLLDESCKIGDPIQKAIGLDDVVFDIELTPNRSDCQSIIGMCRETAAALGKKIREPEIRHVAGVENTKDYAAVTVRDAELCPRYAARVVKNLVIEPSPAWMQKKLRSVGLRPINNIVDITNYVMVEYGHPMHAFDLACVDGGHIVVRRAYEGEVVTTLDGKARPVMPDMLLIADETKGVGIAGVMGGENSEITGNTKAALFEAAVFKASNIRATTRKLRHVTDAAARFIKGVDPVTAMNALNRAMELVEELKAGTVVGEPIDVCAANLSDRAIDVNWHHVNRIIGASHAPEAMAEMLSTINVQAEVLGDVLRVMVPYYRQDIESGIEADWDVAEEVARIYGYYKIAPTLMGGDTFSGRIPEEFADDDRIKDLMVSLGAYEMYNYNFTGPAALDALMLEEDSEKRLAVKLLNPFGEDQSLMRTTLIPGMLGVLALNLNRRTGHGRFFEVGNVHFNNNPDLPEERKMLGIAYCLEGESFFTLKGSIELLLERLGVRGAVFVKGGGTYLHPGQKAQIVVDGQVVGELGTVHPGVLKAFNVSTESYVAEIDVKKLLAHKVPKITYAPIPRYPSADRDIAVVVDEGVSSAEMVAAILGAPTDIIIENVALFDVYRGAGIAKDKKSMAYSFSLRADERTLTEEDITSAVNAIVANLSGKLGASLRSL